MKIYLIEKDYVLIKRWFYINLYEFLLYGLEWFKGYFNTTNTGPNCDFSSMSIE